jgi:hypothetical protein
MFFMCKQNIYESTVYMKIYRYTVCERVLCIASIITIIIIIEYIIASVDAKFLKIDI